MVCSNTFTALYKIEGLTLYIDCAVAVARPIFDVAINEGDLEIVRRQVQSVF